MELQRTHLVVKLDVSGLMRQAGKTVAGRDVSHCRGNVVHPGHSTLRTVTGTLGVDRTCFGNAGLGVSIPVLHAASGNGLSRSRLRTLRTGLSF